jgi:hypothetical protein
MEVQKCFNENRHYLIAHYASYLWVRRTMRSKYTRTPTNRHFLSLGPTTHLVLSILVSFPFSLTSLPYMKKSMKLSINNDQSHNQQQFIESNICIYTKPKYFPTNMNKIILHGTENTRSYRLQ